jgi:hypothetical protein
MRAPLSDAKPLRCLETVVASRRSPCPFVELCRAPGARRMRARQGGVRRPFLPAQRRPWAPAAARKKPQPGRRQATRPNPPFAQTRRRRSHRHSHRQRADKTAGAVDYVQWCSMRSPTPSEFAGYYRGGPSIDAAGQGRAGQGRTGHGRNKRAPPILLQSPLSPPTR